MAYTTGTRAECDAVKDARDRLLGPPSRGFHMGGGRHVPMPQTWDGVGRLPPGWTGYDGPIEHPRIVGEWAVETGGADTTAALQDARATQLTAQERTLLQSARTREVDPDAWLAREAAQAGETRTR